MANTTVFPKVTVTIGADVFTSEGGGGAGGDRVVSVRAEELIWGGQYTVLLDNSDDALNAKDYKGSSIVINFSYIGETGTNIQPTWVDTQQFFSKDGKLLLQLNCFDTWGLLKESGGLAGGAYWNFPEQSSTELALRKLPSSGEDLPAALITAISAQYDKTVQQIVTDTILEAIGKTVDVGIDGDTYMTSEKPQVAGSPWDIVVQAMGATESYLLWSAADNKAYVVKPTAHAVVYSYSTNDLFFSNVESAGLTLPNTVIYWFINKVDPADPTTWLWAHSDYAGGHGVDAASVALLGNIYEHHYNTDLASLENITTQAEADARADTRIAKLQLQRRVGTLVAPMQLTQKLFDAVSVVDYRYGTPRTTVGYVFGILREYVRGVYRITLTLGGTESYVEVSGNKLDIRVTESPRSTLPLGKLNVATGGVRIGNSGIILDTPDATMNAYLKFRYGGADRGGFFSANAAVVFYTLNGVDMEFITGSARDFHFGWGVGTDGNFIIDYLPVADPVVLGALWNDGGTVKISAGPP